MPVIIPDTNVMQIMGGHPNWVDESEDRETDIAFLCLPDWYREEIRALSAINLAIPRCNSTAWVPPQSVIAELARGGEAAAESLLGWGGEIADWADRWFWDQLQADELKKIRAAWLDALLLDLTFLPDAGDQAIARVAYALKSWYAIVLTVDKKTFWHHRSRLEGMGIQVRLPSELWNEMARCL